MNIRQLIENRDFKGIEDALSNNPMLSNEGIPYDEANTTKAHPLHRICDAVFSNTITDEEGVKIARIFLKYGAKVNGLELIEKKDTPLLAAASLNADSVAFLYIENGADINHMGCHGGTALHWAAWCGRDQVVTRLISAGAKINQLCLDFKATPLLWALEGLKNGDKSQNHVECIKILIESGADKTIPNASGKTIFDLVSEENEKLKELINGS